MKSKTDLTGEDPSCCPSGMAALLPIRGVICNRLGEATLYRIFSKLVASIDDPDTRTSTSQKRVLARACVPWTSTDARMGTDR